MRWNKITTKKALLELSIIQKLPPAWTLFHLPVEYGTKTHTKEIA
jgi:hypothetical protein